MIKQLIVFIIYSSRLLASDGDYAHSSWCKHFMGLATAGYVKEASEFVDIDPRLLVIGMSSEGFAIKSDPKKGTTEEMEYKDGKYQIKGVDFDGNSQIFDVSNDEIVTQVSYGSTWVDDGADTFGQEYMSLYKAGLIPKEFTYDKVENINKYEYGKGPDFLFYDNSPQNSNENGTRRFLRSNVKDSSGEVSNYVDRIGRQSPPKGDWGRAAFKTPKSQVYANAAMWKHAQIKLDKLRNDLLEYAKSGKFTDKAKAESYIKQLERPMTKHEQIFWSKVMYNAGQGTQAGTYEMMRKYLDSGHLMNDNYLTTKPSPIYNTAIYENGRHVLDTYKSAEKSGCPASYPSPVKTAFDTKTVLRTSSSSNTITPESSGAIDN